MSLEEYLSRTRRGGLTLDEKLEAIAEIGGDAAVLEYMAVNETEIAAAQSEAA